MPKYGIIYTAFGTQEYVYDSLFPWMVLRNANLPGCQISICALNVKFAGFDGEDDETNRLLKTCLRTKSIDQLIDGPHNIPETVARGMAMRYLIESGADTIIQWDSDEFSSTSDLTQMLDFIHAQSFVPWFRFSYKNFVFDKQTYLAEPFTPPRVHRVNYGNLAAHSFCGDNDIQYEDIATKTMIHPLQLPHLTIPWNVFAPKHYTWLNDKRSYLKQAYQWKRWNHCSFCWDDSKGGLIFNPNLPIPKVLKENA